MIDTNDKATQPLPLDEQPMKRKRGRPATGKAMTPAEKQRAYRERQRKLRDQKPAADHQTVQALDQEVRKLLVELERANARIAELEKELKQRYEKPAKTRKHRDDAPLKSIMAAHNRMEERRKSGELSENDALWHFVGATLQVIEQHGLIDPK